MSVSLSSIVVFHPLDKHFHGPRSGTPAYKLRTHNIVSPSGFVGLRRSTKENKKRSCLLVTDGDSNSLTTDTSQKNSKESEISDFNNLNGSLASDDKKPTLKRAPLTAREKLRAARVLSRYNETKPSKAQLGSKVLEALRESDKKEQKRSGLPAAPINMLDDGKRGMPKAGLTWELPAGFDVTLIISSFVIISTLMFATTYFVWKLGAIHFNEN